MCLRRPLLMLPLALALAACASPRDACLRGAYSEVATLDALIAETEGNLARGYAIEERTSLTTGLDICLGRSSRADNVRIGLSYCNRIEPRTEERAVAIDPAAERRKLAELTARRAEAARIAEERALSCPAG